MRSQKFEIVNENTINKMGVARISHTSEIIEYEDKILAIEEDMHKVANIFRSGGHISLITADTNAGKTYSIINTYKTHFHNPYPNDVRFINIFVVPTRSQADQMKKDYGITTVVADVKIPKKHDFATNNNFCILPDTAGIMIAALRRVDKNAHINLCVDEAHMLFLEARGYRSKALEQLDQLVEIVKERNGAIAFMTATPDALISKSFNSYVHFVNTNQKPAMKKLSLVQSGALTNAHFYNDLVDYIYMLILQGFTPLVRLNNIKMIHAVVAELASRGINAVHLDSSQKGKREVFNVSTGCYEEKYANKVYDGIVNEANLPDEINGKEIQAYFVTSFVELGTNICAVGGRQDTKLFPIYVCNDAKNTNTSSIIQFLNRVRYQVEESAVFIAKRDRSDIPYYANHPDKHKLSLPKFYSLGDFYIKEFKSINAAGKKIDKGLKHLQSELVRNKTINQCINSILPCLSLDGTSNDHDCLTYNEKLQRIEISQIDFSERTFFKYMSQFYYHQDQLAKVLNEDLNIVCDIIDLSESNGNSDSKALDDHETELNAVRDCLMKALENPSLKEVLDREICKVEPVVEQVVNQAVCKVEQVVCDTEQNFVIPECNIVSPIEASEEISCSEEPVEIPSEAEQNFVIPEYNITDVCEASEEISCSEELVEIPSEAEQNFVIPEIVTQNVALQNEAIADIPRPVFKETVLENGMVMTEEVKHDRLAHLTHEQREYFYEASNTLLSNKGKVAIDMLKSSKTSEQVTQICQSVASCDTHKQFKRTYNEFIREDCVNTLATKSIRGLEKLLTEEITYREIIIALGEDEARKVLQISNSQFAPLLKSAITVHMDTNVILQAITRGESSYAIKKLITAHQRKLYNEHYARGNRDFLLGLSGTEQLIVLDSLYQINDSGNVKQTRLTKTILQNIANLLTKAREKYSSKLYSAKDALALCKLVFTLRTKENDFMITGLA